MNNKDRYEMIDKETFEKMKESRKKMYKKLRIAQFTSLILAIILLISAASTIRFAKLHREEINALKSEYEALKESQATTEIETEEIDTTEEVEVNEMSKYASVPLDYDLKLYIYNSAKNANIPAEVLFSLAWKESTFNPNAKSSTNDHGLFQINGLNFGVLANVFGYTYNEMCEKIYDPYVNTDCAVYILTDYRDNFTNNNWHHVLMRYNMGPEGATNLFDTGIYSSQYSRDILSYAESNFNFTDIEIN